MPVGVHGTSTALFDRYQVILLIAQGHYAMVPRQDSNQRPVNRKSDALPIVPPRHLNVLGLLLRKLNVTSEIVELFC